MVYPELITHISCTAKGDQIISSLQVDPLGIGNDPALTGFHDTCLHALEHGIGSCNIRTLLVTDRDRKNRVLHLLMEVELCLDLTGGSLLNNTGILTVLVNDTKIYDLCLFFTII